MQMSHLTTTDQTGSVHGEHLLVLLAVEASWDAEGELPPLSPPEELLSFWLVLDGPAVTSKSQFSFEIRYSSCKK